MKTGVDDEKSKKYYIKDLGNGFGTFIKLIKEPEQEPEKEQENNNIEKEVKIIASYLFFMQDFLKLIKLI